MEDFNIELEITGIYSGLMWIFILLMIIFIIGLMKVFKKCDKPVWLAIIPIYNIWVLFKIVGVPPILSLIPCINSIVYLYVLFLLGSKFNKGTLFSLGLIAFTPIFLIILGFDSSAYNKTGEENKLKPDLMAKDPASEGQVDLLAADPINTIPNFTNLNEESSLKEMPSLEQQLEMPKVKTERIIDIPKEEVKSDLSIPNAFEMKLPKNKEEVLTIEEDTIVKQEPVEELLISENTKYQNNKTQKFCSQCGSPNDVLNKFCVSCGYNFESSK
ncbi:MAG: DUF5684 domain-containing protein [Bacilli bacterium]|nr:DUF5684 domain-containing protein [Bacilli bacterium]MDD4408130.1 DUF5684 domain-containing protein [Bacilli bacterium]